MKKFSIAMLLILTMSLIYGQWSNDAALNLKVTNSSYEEVIPKVAYGPNGDVWVSWFSSENGNYNVRAQKYTFNGLPAFEPEGLLISNNPQMSWLTDWDMKVDSQNNAILSFLDERTGNLDIYVYKVSPTGEMLWGANGIALCNDATEDYTPTVGITDQDNVIVAWMSGDDIKLQKILANGNLAQTEPMIIHTDAYRMTWPQILPQDNDTFILKYAKDSGPFYAVLRYVYAQKYDSTLNPVWTNPATITDLGGISSWTQVFSSDNDGNGGFIMCWYEDRDNDQMRNVYIQHVLSDGTVQFTANGIQPSISTTTQHFYPVCAYDPIHEISYVVWSDTDANQNQRGMRVQAFDTDGNKLYGDEGYVIISLGNESPLATRANVVNGELVVIFTSAVNGSAVDSNLRAFRLNLEGDFVWENQFVTLKSVSSEIIHEDASAFFNNQALVAWEDSRTSPNSLFIQNINFDGTLGEQQTPSGINGIVSLEGGNGNVSEVVLTIGTHIVSPNENGVYYIELEPGTYNIIAHLDTYQDTTITDVVVTEGQITSQNITLHVITANDPSEISIPQNKIQNYPNPFNPNTQIQYHLATPSDVELTIYNAKGQKVCTLINEFKNAGDHQINWNGKNANGVEVSSGIYYCGFKSNQGTMNHKMLLIK